jgi:hypothetical protein
VERERLPAGERLLYARVDLLLEPEARLMELELIEPSLFLGLGDGAPARLARAIAARTGRPAAVP